MCTCGTIASFDPVSIVVCVVRKPRPCLSYSRRRDHINLVLLRSDYKGGGLFAPFVSTAHMHANEFKTILTRQWCLLSSRHSEHVLATIVGPSSKLDYVAIPYEWCGHSQLSPDCLLDHRNKQNLRHPAFGPWKHVRKAMFDRPTVAPKTDSLDSSATSSDGESGSDNNPPPPPPCPVNCLSNEHLVFRPY